jgi:hypothetical protein
MIGSSGTTSWPFLRVIGVPLDGFGMDEELDMGLGQVPRIEKTIHTEIVENSVEKHSGYGVVTLQSECFSGLHHGRAAALRSA